MKKLIIVACIAASTQAQADCFVTTGISDAVSTRAAVASGAIESNPLGEGGVLFAKAAVYTIKKTVGKHAEKKIDAVACPLMTGAYFNNLAIAAGVGSIALPIGTFAAILYINGARFGPVEITYDPNSP